jgi:hypothetical protein
MPSPQRPHMHAAPDIANSAGSPPGRGVPERRREAGAPDRVFGKTARGLMIPCSGASDSLFRTVQGFGRKSLRIRRDRTSAVFKSSTGGQDFQNSLLNSLLAGNSPIRKSISGRGEHGSFEQNVSVVGPDPCFTSAEQRQRILADQSQRILADQSQRGDARPSPLCLAKQFRAKTPGESAPRSQPTTPPQPASAARPRLLPRR